MGAYGFGLNFRVRLILFVLGAKTTHDGTHNMHIILFLDAIKDG